MHIYAIQLDLWRGRSTGKSNNACAKTVTFEVKVEAKNPGPWEILHIKNRA